MCSQGCGSLGGWGGRTGSVGAQPQRKRSGAQWLPASCVASRYALGADGVGCAPVRPRQPDRCLRLNLTGRLPL